MILWFSIINYSLFLSINITLLPFIIQNICSVVKAEDKLCLSDFIDGKASVLKKHSGIHSESGR